MTESSLELISLEEWPLVVVTVTERLSDDEFVFYVDEMEKIRRRREPWAYLLDARVGSPMSSNQRRRYAESAKRDQALIREYTRAAGFVLPYAVHRGYLTAIHWLAPPPYPWKVTSSMKEARAWIDRVWPVSERVSSER